MALSRIRRRLLLRRRSTLGCKGCAAGMRKHVSQSASFVNGTGSFRRAVAADAQGRKTA